MNKHKLSGLLLLLFITGPICSFAKFPGILKRYQLGYSFVMNSADYKQQIKFPGIDTSLMSNKMKTSAAFGVTMGTYIPLKRLGRASSLALSIDYMYNIMTWKTSIPAYGGMGIQDFPFSGATAQMALPIGLDIKFGADAITVKDHRFCGTIGVGAYPSYSATTLDASPTIDPVFAVAPYVKAEAGFFAGICMKLRVMYAIGDIKYMDYKSSSDDGGIHTSSNASLIGKSNLTVSILVMPFSFTWDKHDWWNTY